MRIIQNRSGMMGNKPARTEECMRRVTWIVHRAEAAWGRGGGAYRELEEDLTRLQKEGGKESRMVGEKLG